MLDTRTQYQHHARQWIEIQHKNAKENKLREKKDKNTYS